MEGLFIMIKEEYIINSIPLDNMIAMCYILDEYPRFNDNLKRFIISKNNIDDIYNLYKISNGERIVGVRKVKKFYQENKVVIDIINKYTDINKFITHDYDSKGFLKDSSRIDLFYKYLVNHKDDINKIILVLNKINSLGFRNIYFDEKIDFTNNTYLINTNLSDNKKIIYLDNMEALPNYHIDCIKYKTSKSNYAIYLKLLSRSNLFNQYILVNSFLFDPNSLPKEISIERFTDRIISLKEKQQEFNRTINNSVSLNISIDDLYKDYLKTYDIVEKLDGINSKEKLKESLLIIKKYLDNLNAINKEYDDSIIKEYQGINREELEEEKKKVIELIRKRG